MKVCPMDETVETLFTATLQEAPSVPPKDRITAETRYANSLERSLGGADGVAKAYLAWCTAAESDADETSPETATSATAWAKAADKARQDGMRGIGDEDAYFEVRLA